MHVLWINDSAAEIGGCERYILETVAHLNQLGVQSSLLYRVDQPISPSFTRAFHGAYPTVELAHQIREIAPDLIYIHRLADVASLDILAQCGVPTLRFIHDHKLFCLREHKYTAIGQRTCTRTIGFGCYTCLGFVNKVPGRPGIRITTVGALRREQRRNRALTGIVVGSHYMRDHIAAHGFDPARIHVLPLYSAPPAEMPRTEREGDLLFFAGQLTTGKGIDTLLDALARLKSPARLVVAGTGKFETAYREQAERLNLTDRVSFVGRLSSEQLSDHYRRAACVVVPSRTPETFGLIGPEAMSHGAPVIATQVGGMGEWMRSGENGLSVPPNDVEALATAIDRLLSSPELRARLGARAEADYQARFRPEHHVAQLHRLFCAQICKETAS